MDIALSFMLAAYNYMVWQAVYLTIFMLAVIGSVGMVAPYFISGGLLAASRQRQGPSEGLRLVQPGRGEELLDLMEEFGKRGEYSQGIMSAYQELRSILAGVEGLRIARGLTEREAMERLLRTQKESLNIVRMRELYALYEKARFGDEPVGETELRHAKKIVAELSSELKVPEVPWNGDVGQP